MKIKRKIALPFGALVLACGLWAGCDKEVSPVFYLEVENAGIDSKMQVNGQGGARWNAGDEININGENYSVTRADDGRGTIGEVSRSSQFYRAVFPASIVQGGAGTPVSVSLPGTYNYTVVDGYQKLNLPMVAYCPVNDEEAESYNLYFKHLTGSIIVRVTNTMNQTMYVDRVTVSSNKYSLCGQRTIDMTDIETSAAVTKISTGADTVVNVVVDGVALAKNESVLIQVPVAPVGADNKFTVKISSHYITDSGNTKYLVFDKQQATGGSVARNQVAYAQATLNSANCYQDLPMEYVDGYYIITTPSDYLTFVDAVNSNASGRDGNFRNKNFKLGANINMSGVTVEPVNEFRGIFDGNGKTISNLNVSTSTYTNVGMFSTYTQSTESFVRNLTINGIILQYTGTTIATNVPIYMGGIVGSVSASNNTKVSNCTVKNVKFITPNVNASQFDFGGIVGNVASASNESTFSGCTVNKITVDNSVNKKPFVGGIIGYPLGNVTLSNCSFVSGTTSFAGVDRFGGFIAWTAKDVTFNSCSASFNLTLNGGTSGTRIGGIIASYNNGTKTATYNGCTLTGTITVSNANVTQKGVKYGFTGTGLTEVGAPTTSGLTLN